jgi:hypothetical protein
VRCPRALLCCLDDRGHSEMSRLLAARSGHEAGSEFEGSDWRPETPAPTETDAPGTPEDSHFEPREQLFWLSGAMPETVK